MKTFDVFYYNSPENGKKEFSHKYTEKWKETDYFCPRCGSETVWVCDDEGDYYVGEQHLCVEGGHTFYLPQIDKAINEQDTQRLKGISS